MLKTIKDGKLWLVAQPDHGQVAGYLAARWGNSQFTHATPFPNFINAE